MGGHLAVAEYLTHKMEGYLIDSDDVGYTALHWAAQEGHLSMVNYLVRSCGFDVKAMTKVGLHFGSLSDAVCDLFGHTCCMGTVDFDIHT